ncbi:MAG: flavin monoamine oxidase family protein [Candidatus Acidiferrales bacterium]
MKERKCVVIGGGLAGLAAAYHLTQERWKVTLVEAAGRLGGRVKSHQFKNAPGLVCELGGEWIGNDHVEMQRLCRTFDLELEPHQYSNSFWNQKKTVRLIAPGEWCLSKKSERLWKKFQKRFLKFKPAELRRMDKLDWWTQLEELGFDREDLVKRDLMDSTDFGETIRMNSAYTAATEYLSSKKQRVDDTDEMDFKIVGGNSRLVNALAHTVGRENIHKNWGVTHIIQKNGRVTVRGKGQKPVEADACVCAVPAHCLRRIIWDPAISPEKRAAAEQLQYARITKTAVLCAKRFWPQPKKSGFSVCTSLASDFCFDSTYGQEGRQRILCSYAIGDKADDIAASPREELKNWIVEDVVHACGFHWQPEKIRRIALAIEQQAWQKDPFTGGAYAFYRPGQWFTVRPALQKPHGNVFFAGEHLADWQGFMEGAVVTGKAAADAVLKS